MLAVRIESKKVGVGSSASLRSCVVRLAVRCFALCTLLLLVLLPLLGATDVRMALMDFTTEENSYPAMRAAVDISSLLQPLISILPETSWVERSQLCHAQKEIELSMAQFSRANALRCGKWAKADRLVLGNFARDERGDWALELEIMDVARAETLARTTMTFPGTQQQPLSLLNTNTTTMAGQIRTLHAIASQTATTVAGKVAIAPLFLRDQSRLRLPGQELQDALFDSMEAVAATNQKMRVATFARANRAAEETELAAAGLTEADDEASEKSADAFVWGTYVIGTSNVIGSQIKQLQVNLSVWRRAGTSNIMDSTAIPATGLGSPAIREFMQRLASRAVALAMEPSNASLDSDDRRKIAEAILEISRGDNANPLRSFRSGARPDPEAIQMLELACYFDPDNAQAQEERIGQRYGHWMVFRSRTRNEFWSQWKRSEAWGRYVERFGLHPGTQTNAAARYTTIVSPYVDSLEDILRNWEMANKVQCCGFPSRVPPTVEGEWKAQLLSEYGRRIIRAAEYLAGGPVYEEPPYGEFGHSLTLDAVYRGLTNSRITVAPEKRARLIDSIRAQQAARRPYPATASQPPPPALPTRKPVMENTNWMRHRVALHESPSLDFRPPLLTPAIESFTFPTGVAVSVVSQIENHNGLLWLLATDDGKDNSRRANPELAREMRSTRSRIWNFNPKTGKFAIYSPLEREKVTAFRFAGDELWFSGDHVARLNANNGQFRRYSFADGMALAETTRIAKVGERWFVLGGPFEIASLQPDGTWIQETLPPTRCSQGTDARAGRRQSLAVVLGRERLVLRRDAERLDQLRLGIGLPIESHLAGGTLIHERWAGRILAGKRFGPALVASRQDVDAIMAGPDTSPRPARVR